MTPKLQRPTAIAAAAVTTVALAACGSSARTSQPATTPTSAAAAAPTTTAPARSTAFALNPKLLAAAPASATNPDDVTMLDGLLYVPFQNKAGKDGSPDGSKSTIEAIDPATGAVKATYEVLGRCDGLTADPTHHRLLASVNEDANSSLFVLTPGGVPVHYTYSPDPAEKGNDGTNGGTDSLSVAPDGTIYVAHSNPDSQLPGSNNTAAEFTATLSGSTAALAPVYGINDTAAPVAPAGGKPAAPLGLSDPDSNRFVADLNGGTLLQVAQADSKIVLGGTPGAPLRQLGLTWAPSVHAADGVTPQLDDVVEVTGPGTLFVVDQSSFNVFAVAMTAADRGKFFASQPSPSAGDKPNSPALTTVDMATGVVTPVDTSFGSPKGLLFVPAS